MNNNQTQINFTDPSKVTGLTTNPGDLIIGGEIGLTSLPVGGNGQILFIEHGSPVWITPSNDSLGVHDDSKFSYLYNENDLTINNKNRLIFEKLNSSILVINESNEFKYEGGDNINYLFNIGIHYKSNDSTFPYEIADFSIYINSNEVFSKKYGYNGLDNIIEKIVLKLATNDTISFYINLSNTKQFTLKQSSIIAITNI